MKEQVKAIVFDFKVAGWSVQKLEKELKFSNGTLGKVIAEKAGMSDFKFTQLLAFHEKELKKPVTVTKELEKKIADNNNPENKKRIEEEREGKKEIEPPTFKNEVEKMIWEEEQKLKQLNK